jgi:3',5'-cyclic AMP phosphodiesterase CpdA
MRRFLAICAVVSVLALAPGAQAPVSKPFFFLQFSDTQFGMFTADKDFAQETANFDLAIATANRLKPAFVVVTGDLVNKPGDAAQIAEFHRIARKLDPAIQLFHVAGNHDIGNAPTAASIAAYVKAFGRDYYSFRVQDLYGIVLDSTPMTAPDQVSDLVAAQDSWLQAELERARTSGAKHIVVFQHHSLFLKDAGEPNTYFNIPIARRSRYLDWYRLAGVQAVMAGHYHRNALARDRGLEMITTGPVGMPLGEGTQSGMRVVIVSDAGLKHRYYALGELPNKIDAAGSK